MADIDIAVQNITRAGLEPAYNSSIIAADDYFFLNGEGVFVHLVNGGTASEVTIETVTTVDGLAVEDLVRTLPANADRVIGPFPKDIYSNSERKVKMSFTTPTTLEVAVLKV